jgi:hypothetical protein
MSGRNLTAWLLALGLAGSAPVLASEGWEARDKRFHGRGPWNFALHQALPELDVAFNGVDFGHSHLYETLLRTGGTDVPAVEDRARRQTLACASRPGLPPNEEVIAPTYMRLAWRAQNVFDEAHALHRATYDIYASKPVADKDAAIRRALAYYQRSPYAVTAQRLDHRRLDEFPYSRAFRQRFPLFNATIWAYHYLQGAAYRLCPRPTATRSRTGCGRSWRPMAGTSTARRSSGPSCRLPAS